MRTFIALGLCATLAVLAGCVTEATEAIEASPLASSLQLQPQPAAGHEVSSMFADEKARASASELPGQF